MYIENHSLITAPVDVVWQLTEDIERWPSITPTVTSLERLDGGPIGPGSRARLLQPGLRPAVWTVTRFEPKRLFEWETTIYGVRFTGRHELAETDDGCRNTLGLVLAGPAAGFLGVLAGRKLRASLATENAGFKRCAEAISAR